MTGSGASYSDSRADTGRSQNKDLQSQPLEIVPATLEPPLMPFVARKRTAYAPAARLALRLAWGSHEG